MTLIKQATLDNLNEMAGLFEQYKLFYQKEQHNSLISDYKTKMRLS